MSRRNSETQWSVSPQGFCGFAAARRQQRGTPLVKQKNASLMLAISVCGNTYFDTICVHIFKNAYTLSKVRTLMSKSLMVVSKNY